ncbi:amidohydrolase family-domain-containing protein [Colletotrichum phormii]|uniref:Amidohydrolase family-domain-containing protein n=1 Tax=Colletotrichum phormii TaxID=359342 RepID=A0AAI9ZZM6_9PEZI|nr:amidohydrolase family-domain-containing protein [Colletotrichum phormii]KAK1640740.1 amidohydrolase family-domain-containing protein [Colletotrichum phormii]
MDLEGGMGTYKRPFHIYHFWEINSFAYINGRVYTIDKSRPWAEAFIVDSQGTSEAVGTNEEIEATALQRKLVTYNLRNKFIMPGIHDAHTHLLQASMQRLSESSISCCACAYSNIFGDWVVGNFYQVAQFPDGNPDRKYLDDLYPNTPVIVREVPVHRILLNSEGLRRLSLDRNVKDPPGGYYIRRADGELTGEVVETAQEAVWRSLPIPPLRYVKVALEHAIRECHRYGITSVQEATATTAYLHAVKELEQENGLHLDISTHIVAGQGIGPDSKETLSALIDIAEAFSSKHVRTNFIKLFLDGAPLPPEFTQCDLDEGRNANSKILLGFSELQELLVKYDSKGMTCKIHVAGEGSVRRALDVYTEVRKRNPNGPKHEIAHCNAIHPDDIQRIKRLDLTAEMSPAMFHNDIFQQLPHLFKWPFNDVLASGARMTFGSDWILTPTPSLFDSLAHIVETIKEPDIENHVNKTDKQIGGELICRAITLGGATAVGLDRVAGSIEVGKKANFISVDRDLNVGEFAGAEVLTTCFEGKTVFDFKK